jgi:hypothetical protein
VKCAIFHSGRLKTLFLTILVSIYCLQGIVRIETNNQNNVNKEHNFMSVIVISHFHNIVFFVRHCQNLRNFSCVSGFYKCHNLSERTVKLILKILSDLEPLMGSTNKKTLYSTRSCVNWAFFGTRGPLKRSFHWLELCAFPG